MKMHLTHDAQNFLYTQDIPFNYSTMNFTIPYKLKKLLLILYGLIQFLEQLLYFR
jgi:hypothetical protein